MQSTKKRPSLGRSAKPVIDPTEHVAWAQEIGRKVRARYKFPKDSAEQEDLESVAVLELLTCAKKFDASFMTDGSNLTDAFRGWAHMCIVGQCSREARRMRNGGTYNTRKERKGEALVAENLGGDADMRPEIVELSEREWNELEDDHDRQPPVEGHKPQLYPRMCANPDCPRGGRSFLGTINRRYCSTKCEEEAVT